MSNRYPGIADPQRQCREQLAPFLAAMAEWQGRCRPFSLEWMQLSRVRMEVGELESVLTDQPRGAPFEPVARAGNDA